MLTRLTRLSWAEPIVFTECGQIFVTASLVINNIRVMFTDKNALLIDYYEQFVASELVLKVTVVLPRIWPGNSFPNYL